MNRLDNLQWNIRSVKSNLDNLKLKVMQAHPQIILITETFLYENPILKIKRYEIIRQDRHSNGGGLAILVDKNIKYKIIDFPYINLESRGQIQDSKRALLKLTEWRLHSKNEALPLRIREELIEMKNEGFHIVLVWVPSHTNVYGNEKADELVKLGCNQKLEERTVIKGDTSDFSLLILN
ncbi:hypothetical protein HHI36_004978 [Cryptolaemus montrouzieri]|uniref:RNase H type-1 domain-containing protein n=1 Tax=Cryptolaemus montrouzieri TaxID=559131 RepID=A0ABD2NTB0_9CUCU